MLGLPCTTPLIGSTVVPENFFNSTTNDLYKLNLLFATGKSMTTYISGLPFPFARNALTTDALNSPSSSVELPIHLPIFPSQKGHSQKTCSEYECPVRPGNLVASSQAQVHSTTSQRHLGIGTLPKPFGAMDNNPRFRFKYQSTLRRLANNIQEPFRTLSLQAIDTSITWLEGKPAPRASALRSPWSLTPNLQRQLKQFLRKWHLQVLPYQVPCHNPSFKMVFIKHAAVLDQLCNHKQAITDWSSGQKAICCCKHWLKFKTAALNPSDPHWVLAGSLLHSLLPADLSVIAEGSLLNKVFPSKKEYHTQPKTGLHSWTKRNGLPSMPNQDISDLCHKMWTEHSKNVTCHITKSSITAFQQTFDGAIFHCEDKQASSLPLLPGH